MMRRGWRVLLGVAISALPLHAQGRIGADTAIPAAYRPPTGMCRVWLEGVPAAQQPASTDCATAMRTRPPRSRVIFGDPVRENPPAGVNAFHAGSAAYGTTPLPQFRRRRDDTTTETPRHLHGDLCLDADHDGQCDDTAGAADACLDANRDGKCDDERRDVVGMIERGELRAGGAIGGVCINRSHDGKCDETWPVADICLDRNHDGKCDEPTPAMKAEQTAPAPAPNKQPKKKP
jgi:hypothetical protein